jgi:hypothetical protein
MDDVDSSNATQELKTDSHFISFRNRYQELVMKSFKEGYQ